MRPFPALLLRLGLLGSSLFWHVGQHSRVAGASPATAAGPSHRTYLPTKALISDAKLARLVDVLARSQSLDSPAIGVAGEASSTYLLFDRVVHAATRQQVLALLRHESPIVRGYMARHVALTAELGGVEALYPLLGDSAPVATRVGCRASQTPVSHIVLEALSLRAEHPRVQSLLLRAAQDISFAELRPGLLDVVAQHRPDEARALAKSWLRNTDPQLLLGAVGTLHAIADVSSYPALCALASSAHAEVRMNLISTFAVLDHACAEPALRRLTEDRDERVRGRAGDTYVRIRQREPAVMRRLLHDPVRSIRVRVALALAGRANPQDLTLLREYLAAEQDGAEVLSVLQSKNTPETAALLRELVSPVPR
jgi:HEAT repeat protein